MLNIFNSSKYSEAVYVAMTGFTAQTNHIDINYNFIGEFGGTAGTHFADGASIEIEFARTGEKGTKGAVGDKGDRNDKGQKGDKGFDGTIGDKGQKGIAGEYAGKGQKGNKGEEGASGTSVLRDKRGKKKGQG